MCRKWEFFIKDFVYQDPTHVFIVVMIHKLELAVMVEQEVSTECKPGHLSDIEISVLSAEE